MAGHRGTPSKLTPTGSILIACEKLGRKCRMMEIEPYYCDVIISRWQNFTGGEALKLP